MARYIDADELQRKYDELPLHEHNFYTTQIWGGIFRGLIKETPTADVAPVVHGKWEIGTHHSFLCSVCGWEHECYTLYCPDCGAKMDGDTDG